MRIIAALLVAAALFAPSAARAVMTARPMEGPAMRQLETAELMSETALETPGAESTRMQASAAMGENDGRVVVPDAAAVRRRRATFTAGDLDEVDPNKQQVPAP